MNQHYGTLICFFLFILQSETGRKGISTGELEEILEHETVSIIFYVMILFRLN